MKTIHGVTALLMMTALPLIAEKPSENPDNAQESLENPGNAKVAQPSRYQHNLRPLLSIVKSRIRGRRPVNFDIIGDSTANGDDEWFERFMEIARASAPDHRIVKNVRTAPNTYATTVVQPGAGDPYYSFPVAGGYPPSVDGAYTGTLPDGEWTVFLDFALGAGAVAGDSLFSKWDERGSSFFITIGSTADTLEFHSNGVYGRPLTLDAGSIAHTARHQNKIRVVASGGSVRLMLYERLTSSDSWVLVHDKNTGAADTALTLPVLSPPQDLNIGSRGGRSPILRDATVYDVAIFTGDMLARISPPIEFYRKGSYASDAPALIGSPRFVTRNFSVSGKNFQQIDDLLANEADTMFTNTPQSIVFLNSSINDAGSAGSPQDYLKNMQACLDKYLARNPDALVVFVQQNLTDPVQRSAKSGGGLAELEFLQYDQSLRHAAGIQWALGKGYAVLLFSEAIFADGRAMSVLMPDGVHPSTTATDEILVPILDSHWTP